MFGLAMLQQTHNQFNNYPHLHIVILFSLKGSSIQNASSMQARKCQKESDQSDGNPLNIPPDTSTALVLEVIGLMCDGQHRKMQDYLREQLDNFRV